MSEIKQIIISIMGEEKECPCKDHSKCCEGCPCKMEKEMPEMESDED